ncbi:DsbA family protein [Streptomyces winkii]|uniref:DsbA family protein n=1 Tax=Streptomyces winkii TaxID=3051178 RepID=UPI0028D752B0|nr:thioredoxin domain-containing protein [Streptomyces sp. DSM 40971]
MGEEERDRERLRVERELGRQDNRRLRALKLTGVAVFAVGIASLAALAVAVTGKGGSEATQARPVTTGSPGAPATLTVYEDFRCPDCRRFDARFGTTIDDLRESGRLDVDRHLVTHVDDTRGGRGSHFAAEAALCALDEHKFAQYRRVLYENQPPEREDRFGSGARLLRLAAHVDGLSDREFEKCVRHGLQSGRVDRMNAAFEDAHGHRRLPLVLLNGKELHAGPGGTLTPEKLRRAVEQGGGKGA